MFIPAFWLDRSRPWSTLSGNRYMTALEVVRMENWRIVESSGVASTAQSMGFRLRGRAYGHPSYSDGETITSSEILKVEGNRVFCRNRIYFLGEPSGEFLEMVAALKVTFDIAQPTRSIYSGLGKVSKPVESLMVRRCNLEGLVVKLCPQGPTICQWGPSHLYTMWRPGCSVCC